MVQHTEALSTRSSTQTNRKVASLKIPASLLIGLRFHASRFVLVAASLLFVAAHIAAQDGATQTRPASTPTSSAGAARRVTVTKLGSDASAQVDQQAVDASVAEDANITRALASYRTRVAALDKPIARLDAAIEKRGIGGGGIGNFVADAMRSEASRRARRPILLAIVNTGGIRKNSITAGSLSTTDVYELLPFENALVLVDLTGTQLSRLLAEVTKARDAQSGAIITFKSEKDDTAEGDTRNTQLVSAMLASGNSNRPRPIEPKRIYTIATIDYLVNRGGDYAILKEAQRTRPLGVTLRDAVIEHLRREAARGRAVTGKLDNRYRRETGKNKEGIGAAAGASNKPARENSSADGGAN